MGEVGLEDSFGCVSAMHCYDPKVVIGFKGSVDKYTALVANVLKVNMDFLVELKYPVYDSKEVVGATIDMM